MFFIIGAQRCGSTWLHSVLNEHPCIAMAKPVKPEPKFFLNPDNSNIETDRYFQKHFSDTIDIPIKGEKSTSYIEYPEIAHRIRSLFPSAKAVVILRNPIHRAISNYRFSLQNGIEYRTIFQAFNGNAPTPSTPDDISVSPFSYVERGEYIKYISPWSAIFKHDLRVIILEEILSDINILYELYAWLGAEKTYTPTNFNKIINETTSLTKPRLNPMIIQKLHIHFLPYTRALEYWLGRKIPSWHDTL